MEAYGGFASVYDQFMDNVPYDEWCEEICAILKEHGICDGTVLDLGCGTGAMTRRLAARGYDMIGVDLSADMLAQARAFEEEPSQFSLQLSQSSQSLQSSQSSQSSQILYLQQDMCELELFGTVRAVVCLCDSLNYLLEEEELFSTFQRVRQYLDRDGIFVFDVNTVYKYRDVIGETVICENREEECFTWENFYDEETAINEYVLNIFKKTASGLYERFEEVHYQRAYLQEQIEALLESAHLSVLAVFDETLKQAPTATCERMYFVVQNS